MYSDILPLCIADVPYLMSDVVNKTEFDVRGLLVGRKMTGGWGEGGDEGVVSSGKFLRYFDGF